MGCLPWLKSPISPGFEIRDFPSSRMTAGNTIELILPRVLVLTRQIYPPFALSWWFETVLPREGLELDLTSPSGILCRYRRLIFFSHPGRGVSSPSEPYYYYCCCYYYYYCYFVRALPRTGFFSWLLPFVSLEHCFIIFKCFAPWGKD